MCLVYMIIILKKLMLRIIKKLNREMSHIYVIINFLAVF